MIFFLATAPGYSALTSVERGLTIREVECRTALSPCGLEGFDYSLNPYRGCQHGCVYCYSPCVIREKRDWGTFVDVRRNMPTVLAKELRRRDRGYVWLGSVCDAYQPVEGRYSVTRRCLEQLLEVDWPVSLLTKGHLVARDYGLMREFSDFDLGFSINCSDDSIRQATEPDASSVEDRLRAISEACDEGLDPWAFLAPLIPGIADRREDLESLIEDLARAGVRRIGFDPFRFKPMCWPRMRDFLEDREISISGFKRALNTPGYFESVADMIENECDRRGLEVMV